MTTTDAPTPTPDEIDAAILVALAGTDRPMLAWAKVRRRLPGTLWQRVEALTRLFESAQVNVIKVDGRNYVQLADEFDIAATRRDRPRMRAL